jgi:putative flippase GtrA
MGERDAAVPTGLRVRATRALRERRNWEQLAKFCIVGALGYAVNLVVYVTLLDGANLHYRLAATGSFLVAVTNNYLWNRLWTFRHDRGPW